ncbi:MAG: mechanosensitive ion channel family protein [Acidobacteria bacterium]|nr:mechanosensitive ion channel family protein [Acidobacteriota bacterium]
MSGLSIHPYLLVSVRVVLILVGAFLLTLLINRLIRGLWTSVVRMLQNRGSAPDAELEKQAATIAGILRKSSAVVIYAFAVMTALRELGYDVRPLLAGAGVVGLAIGFGAQNLVRDVISGFFLLIENQIRVNDVVTINDTSGMVEEINLRTTVLRDSEGTVHVFPNGIINKLANKTREFSYYVFTIPIAYSDDVDAALRLIQQVSEETAALDQFKPAILAPVEIFGVDHLGESHMTVKARIKTLPGKQWDVGREMNRRIRAGFLAAGLTAPVRATTTIETLNANPDSVRTLIREVVRDELKNRSAGG